MPTNTNTTTLAVSVCYLQFCINCYERLAADRLVRFGMLDSISTSKAQRLHG